MQPEITEEEKGEIRAALKAARNGGATSEQLFHAHTLAERAKLPNVIAELRTAIRRQLPDPHAEQMVLKSIGFGVISGVITHFLLKAAKQKRSAT